MIDSVMSQWRKTYPVTLSEAKGLDCNSSGAIKVVPYYTLEILPFGAAQGKLLRSE